MALATWAGGDAMVVRIPCPGSSWVRIERRQAGWVGSALNGGGKHTGILHNPMYRGQVTWNRLRWVRSATNSHKRRRVENPRAEWIVREEERLRIDVGERVARGLSRVAANHTGRSPQRYLLSGLLKCSECGAGYQIAGAMHYACSTYGTAVPAAARTAPGCTARKRRRACSPACGSSSSTQPSGEIAPSWSSERGLNG
jgi:hypothetical protein